MITGVQPKFLLHQDDNGDLNLDKTFEHLFGKQRKMNYRLVREHDSLERESEEITWIEWNESGRFKAKHDTPDIGRSLIMSPFNDFFTWQTTDVTEIVEQREDYIKFKTKNSTYELFKI